MESIEIRDWHERDADAVAALSARYFAPDPSWTPSAARAQLTADALGGGAQVRVATRAGEVVGVAGWVTSPPWVFLWPVTATDQPVAAALLDAALVACRGPGLTTARVSTRTVEPHKRAAVAARGFVRSIDFVQVARATAPLAAPPVAATPRRGAAIDRGAMHALHEESFAAVPNAAPMSAADFARLLDDGAAWPAATSAWHDEHGACVGFVIGCRAPDHGVVEAIGVAPSWRGRGLAAAMLADLFAAAVADGTPEVRALIASTNTASLALHTRAGFAERARKELWDLAL